MDASGAGADASDAGPGKVSVASFLSAHKAFLDRVAATQMSDFVEPIRHLCHQNPTMAFYLWVRLFPWAWACLRAPDASGGTEAGVKACTEITAAMVSLLTKQYHRRQKSLQPNVVKALLEGTAKCEPPLDLPIPVLRFHAKEYNVWHVIIAQFEAMTMADPPAPAEGGMLPIRFFFVVGIWFVWFWLCLACEPPPLWSFPFSPYPHSLHPPPSPTTSSLVAANPAAVAQAEAAFSKRRETAFEALGELYLSLSEFDAFHGLWNRRASASEPTLAALSYEQHGMFQKAQDIYYEAMSIEAGKPTTGSDRPHQLLLWEKHWVYCAKQLNQWDILSSFARAEQPKLLLQVKSGDVSGQGCSFFFFFFFFFFFWRGFANLLGSPVHPPPSLDCSVSPLIRRGSARGSRASG